MQSRKTDDKRCEETERNGKDAGMSAGKRDAEYTMGRTEGETDRLIQQSQLYDDITRRFFLRCGIGKGMKVLDVGSGAGDVSLTLAEFVGPEGSVVGVDVNADILETARSRAEEAGFRNIEFVAGDVREADLPDDFDAAVGRLVLMYMADPTEALRSLKKRLRPNGVAAFQEIDFSPYESYLHPDTPVANQLIVWAKETFERSGARLQMGRELFQTFVNAGFPEPEMHFEAPMGGSPDWAGFAYVVNSFRSLAPLMEAYGIASAEELGIDTLEERLRGETVRSRQPFLLPPHVAAHTALPG